MGYDELARAEAKRAFELSANLPRENRLLVEARFRETASEWSKAIEIYRALWMLFPDNADYGIQLASAETYAGQGRQALAVIESLDGELEAAGLGGGRDRVGTLGGVAVLGRQPDVRVLAGQVAGPARHFHHERAGGRGLVGRRLDGGDEPGPRAGDQSP